MKIRILGCSGGIGGRHMRTTSMLVDHDVLIDAGTGVGDLTLAELSQIDHVFLTHCHLDHTASIPFLVDTVGAMRSKPLIVHALPDTIQVLKDHIFNWKVWPDFTVIPDPEHPFMTYAPILQGETVQVKRRRFSALPANHTVPAIGYAVSGEAGATLVFTGDTTNNDALWPIVNRIRDLRYLVIETAFCNREEELARASKHLSPRLLAEELAKLQRDAEIFITHLKPGEIELTMQEIEEDAGEFKPRMLQNGQVFDL
jgi:ribonuclease BN (tRNA processing enzyme)